MEPVKTVTKDSGQQTYWHAPPIPALGKWRQEDEEVSAIFGYKSETSLAYMAPEKIRSNPPPQENLGYSR